MIYVPASLLWTRLTRINLTRRDMLPNPSAQRPLHLCWEEKYHPFARAEICLSSLSEGALTGKVSWRGYTFSQIKITGFKLRLFTNSRLHLFRFFYLQYGHIFITLQYSIMKLQPSSITSPSSYATSEKQVIMLLVAAPANPGTVTGSTANGYSRDVSDWQTNFICQNQKHLHAKGSLI